MSFAQVVRSRFFFLYYSTQSEKVVKVGKEKAGRRKGVGEGWGWEEWKGGGEGRKGRSGEGSRNWDKVRGRERDGRSGGG